MLKIGPIVLCVALVLDAGVLDAAAQDQEIYDAIDCSQWTLNPDGTWDTGPRAEIRGAHRRLSNLKHLDLAGLYVDGVDITAWLNAKCVNKCKKFLGIVDMCS